MGLFDKIKKMFKRSEEEDIGEEKVEEESLEEQEIDEEDSNEEYKENIKEKEEKKLTKKEEKKKKKEEQKETKDEVKESVKVYEKGLTKTRENFVSKLINLTRKYNKVTEEYFDELEEILIMADIGVDTVMSFMDRLRKRVRNENIEDLEYLKEVIVDELFIIYVSDEIIVNKINYAEKAPTVILFVGVNGVGKTTTIAKMAAKLHDEGKSTMMIAGDTFRAGAIEQLKEWADRTDSKFYGGSEGSDPSSVIYDGLEKAINDDIDVVLIDTAGRLQNKDNLMRELEKINKVIGKIVPNGPHETLLVIDATTGQNGISQAKAFKEITNITGIVLTKLDGTAKGGIVLAIKESVGIPVKYIGLGERKEDLQVFDIEKYIYGLFKDMM
jgi:fused signal recognition particle receptor